MNVVLLAGGAGIVLLAFAALAVARSWKPTLWALGAVLSVSPLALAQKVPALGNDTVFKAAIIGLVVLLWARIGIRVRWPVGVILGAFLFALTVSAAHLVPAIAVDSGLAAKAFAGFFLTPAALMVAWRREHLRELIRVVVALPLLSIGLGVLLQAAGFWQVVSDSRLGGALIGPHLALLSISAAFAALSALTVFGESRWAIWLLVDCAVAFLTLTRGALLAAGILIIALGVWTVRSRRTAPPAALKTARRVLAATVAVAAVALPLILARNQGNSYEGSFNTSGREQAWPFYISLSEGSPLLGRGLGYANIANATLHPFGVQSEFESPHNEYIHLWVDGGLLLAVPFFVGLLALAAVAARATRQPIPLVGMLAATLVYSFVDNTFSTPQFAVVLGLLLAALMAHRVEPAPRQPRRVRAVALHGRALPEHLRVQPGGAAATRCTPPAARELAAAQ